MAQPGKPPLQRILVLSGLFFLVYLLYGTFTRGFSLDLLAYSLVGGALFGLFYFLIGRLLLLIFKAVGGRTEE